MDINFVTIPEDEQIKDLDGNRASPASSFQFTTVQFSEKYYYRIFHALNGLALYANSSTKELFLGAEDNSFVSLNWRFTETDGGNYNYTLSNQFFGPDQLIEAASPDDDNPPFLAGPYSPDIPFTGQQWEILYVEDPTYPVDIYRLRARSLGANFFLAQQSIDPSDIDMRPENTNGTQYWFFVRHSIIN